MISCNPEYQLGYQYKTDYSDLMYKDNYNKYLNVDSYDNLKIIDYQNNVMEPLSEEAMKEAKLIAEKMMKYLKDKNIKFL